MHQRKIFNHDVITGTQETVARCHLYCGRILGTTEPDDIVQLHPQLRPEWSAICAHYHRIGLSHSQNVIWDVSLTVLPEYPDYTPSVFYFGDSLSQDTPIREWFRRLDPAWAEVVEQLNCKNKFTQLAERLGVPTPQTHRFSSKAKIQEFDQLPYPCYLKPAVSVNGVGICRCQDEADLRQALQFVAADIPLQVQQEVNAIEFLNLQYRIVNQQAERLAVTSQILQGCSHIGNRYPSPHQPWELFDPIAQWMAEHGMKEIFAFDVAVVEESGQSRYFAIECNPRFNGSSYPTGIAQKLNLTCWANESFKTDCRSLHELDLSGLEYDPASGTGVILVNWGSILVGKLGVLLAGSIDQQQVLRERLKQRLAQPVPQIQTQILQVQPQVQMV